MLYIHEKTADGFNARRVEKVLCHEKTKFQQVTIVEHANLGKTLYLDSCFQADDNFQTEYHQQMVSLVRKADVNKILVCGSGPGGLVKTCLEEFSTSSPAIVAIEYDKEAFHLYQLYLHDWGYGGDARVTQLFSDAFQYLGEVTLQPQMFSAIFWDIDAEAIPHCAAVDWARVWRMVNRNLSSNGFLVATAGFIAERAKQSPYTIFLDSLQEAFPAGKVTDYTRLNWRFFSAKKV